MSRSRPWSSRRPQSVAKHADGEGIVHDLPFHPPSRSGAQTLLITRNPIDGAEGWGWRGGCVVNAERLKAKAEAGGDIADVLIHEWVHAIHLEVINGRVVPWADDAEKMHFRPEVRGDGQMTWHRWFRYALGDLSVEGP